MDDNLKKFWEAMCDELLAAHRLLSAADTPFNRRTFVRTSFAAIEGITYTLKSYALSRLRGGKFSAAEEAILREESVTLDGTGRIQIQQKFIPIDSNIRFAFSMFGRAIGKEFELDCSGRQWQAFKMAIAVRNRIVHPRTTAELGISDEELLCTTMATRWIVGTMMLVMIDRIEELTKEAERLKVRLREALPGEGGLES